MMAALCRHGIPLRLYNIRKTGERMAYVLRLLESVMGDHGCPHKLIILYDISCKLKKYLKVFQILVIII
jgi:hypothetical protein